MFLRLVSCDFLKILIDVQYFIIEYTKFMYSFYYRSTFGFLSDIDNYKKNLYVSCDEHVQWIYVFYWVFRM